MTGMPRYRFAPSPNGRLHLGHGYSALLNQSLARERGGLLLLRLEDIDRQRCTPALAEGVLADLAWLGVVPEEPVRRQSEHFPEYGAALDSLKARALVYPCRCSRGDIGRAVALREAQAGRNWPRDPDGSPLYPGSCRDGCLDPRKEAVAWRLDMARALERAGGPPGYLREEPDGSLTRVAAAPERWGDVVLARKETPTSYHLSVVVDDAIQEITHVVRGRDLEAATDVHVLLQRLLGLPTPVYRFHELITGADGLKLAKSRGSEALANLRGRGVTAAEIRAALGFG